jgi:hypothetical protein
MARAARRALRCLACAAALALAAAKTKKAPAGPFTTTLSGDGGPPIGETYVNTPGASNLYISSLADVDPLVRRARLWHAGGAAARRSAAVGACFRLRCRARMHQLQRVAGRGRAELCGVGARRGGAPCAASGFGQAAPARAAAGFLRAPNAPAALTPLFRRRAGRVQRCGTAASRQPPMRARMR